MNDEVKNIHNLWPLNIGDFHNDDHPQIKEELLSFFKSYEKGVDICKTVSAAIEINGSGPPRKPNPNPSPNAPPRTDTTKILSTNNSIRIILGFKNI